MSHIHCKIQAAFFASISRLIPTCFLQGELSKRIAVVSFMVGMEETLSKTVSGPCVVTVNRD